MNQTKKITQGAIILAIIGALMTINMRLAGVLSTFMILIIPVSIIIYCTMHNLKDGIVLSISLLLIAFILNAVVVDPYSIVYYPVGILVGLAYSWGISKQFDTRKLAFIAIFTFVIGEIIANYIILPILGIKVEAFVQEMKVYFDTMTNLYVSNGIINQEGLAILQNGLLSRIELIILLIFLISVVLVGIMEGFIIHILALILLSRLKIKNLGKVSLLDMKPSKVLSYLCMLGVFGALFSLKISNDTIALILLGLGLFGFIILIYYGYIFILLYIKGVKKRSPLIFILLGFIFLPFLLTALMLIGFLYGSGPLREYILRNIGEKNEKD